MVRGGFIKVNHSRESDQATAHRLRASPELCGIPHGYPSVAPTHGTEPASGTWGWDPHAGVRHSLGPKDTRDPACRRTHAVPHGFCSRGCIKKHIKRKVLGGWDMVPQPHNPPRSREQGRGSWTGLRGGAKWYLAVAGAGLVEVPGEISEALSPLGLGEKHKEPRWAPGRSEPPACANGRVGSCWQWEPSQPQHQQPQEMHLLV